MKCILRLSFLCSLLWGGNFFAQTPGLPNCCFDCSCYFCGHIQDCLNAGPTFPPADCNPPTEGGNCGIGTGTLCSTFWENNDQGVTGAFLREDGVPTDCIPIDGGLGFLIAGGIGMGVLGIRRRKEDALKCA